MPLAINQASLKHAAQTLSLVLERYAQTDPGAARLGSSLEKLIEAAIQGQIQHPLVWRDIPGDYLFNETNISQYSDLEAAYARFKIEATGGETLALKAIRARTASRKAAGLP